MHAIVPCWKTKHGASKSMCVNGMMPQAFVFLLLLVNQQLSLQSIRLQVQDHLSEQPSLWNYLQKWWNGGTIWPHQESWFYVLSNLVSFRVLVCCLRSKGSVSLWSMYIGSFLSVTNLPAQMMARHPSLPISTRRTRNAVNFIGWMWMLV